MRLTMFGVVGLVMLAAAGARAQDMAPAAPAVDVPAPAVTPPAFDGAGAASPTTQPPPFVPTPGAPRTGPKASDLADAEAESDAESRKSQPAEQPKPPELRVEAQTSEVAPLAAPPVEPAAPVVVAPARRPALAGLGAALLLGGGFQQFTNGNLQDVTGGGGFWNLRAVAGTHKFLGLEAAYVGGAHNMNALGFGNRAALISNGAEAAARLNLPIADGPTLFSPFGFVGVGWSRYNVVNTDTRSSDVRSLDDIMTVPYGGGIGMAYRAFIADARFTYRSTFFNDLMRSSGGRLDSWGVSAQMGVSF
jgi:hypothetical protein